MSDSTFDPELEKLLKLLKESEPLYHNDPFVMYLKKIGVEKGDIPVKVQDVIKLYKKMSIKKAIEICKSYVDVQYIEGIAHFCINKKVVKRKPSVSKSTMKFEYFLEKTNVSAGEEFVNKNHLYNYYDTWCYRTRKNNPFSKTEFFELCRKYFDTEGNTFGINRSIQDYLNKGDVAMWREKRAKKKKA